MRETVWTRLQKALQCWIGLHHVSPELAVHNTGAVFAGGMCARCFKIKVGPFLGNHWDDSQTEVRDGVHYLKGVNPRLAKYLIMDLEVLEEIAAQKREKLKKKSPNTAQ